MSPLIPLLDHIQAVTYPGYSFHITLLPRHEGWLLWATFMAPCSVKGGPPVQQTTRRWHLSPHPTHEEFAGTCLKLVLTSVEHEAREAFKWKGVRVFDPHHTIPALAAIAAK